MAMNEMKRYSSIFKMVFCSKKSLWIPCSFSVALICLIFAANGEDNNAITPINIEDEMIKPEDEAKPDEGGIIRLRNKGLLPPIILGGNNIDSNNSNSSKVEQY